MRESSGNIFNTHTHTPRLRIHICQFLASSEKVNRIVCNVAFHMLSDKSYDLPSHNETWSKCQNELPTSSSGQYKCQKYVIFSLRFLRSVSLIFNFSIVISHGFRLPYAFGMYHSSSIACLYQTFRIEFNVNTCKVDTRISTSI